MCWQAARRRGEGGIPERIRVYVLLSSVRASRGAQAGDVRAWIGVCRLRSERMRDLDPDESGEWRVRDVETETEARKMINTSLLVLQTTLSLAYSALYGTRPAVCGHASRTPLSSHWYVITLTSMSDCCAATSTTSLRGSPMHRSHPLFALFVFFDESDPR